MAHYFAHRARKVAWSHHETEKHGPIVTSIRRVGTDSTLGDGDSTTVPTSIKRVSASEGIQTFVSALEKNGCVIIEDFANSDTLRKAALESQSWRGTSKAHRPLIAHSPTIRESFVANRLYQDLCDGFLTTEIKKWKHHETDICHPTLSSVSTTTVRDTTYSGALGRYDAALGAQHIAADKYKPGRDSMMGLLIPSSETVAVHAVVGSHLLGSSNSELDEEIVEEELKAGEALVVLGSLYYYLTIPHKHRSRGESPMVHSIWSCTGVYRPEEQMATLIDPKELKTYSKVIQERLR